LQCRSNLETLITDIQTLMPSLSHKIGGEGQDKNDEKRWIMYLQLSCERTVSTNCRYLQRHLSQYRSSEPNLPTWSQLRNEIVRSAANTLHIYEELLTFDFLRYAPNFL